MGNTRKPGGGRKPSKPEYSAAKNLAQQMKAAADLYTDQMSLQAIADALSLNPIKVRKLLITAGVYESDTAKLVQQTFNAFRETQSYSAAVTSTISALQLSRPSVTSYENGYAVYEEDGAHTVMAIDRCGDYRYDFNDGTYEVVPAAVFEDVEWSVRLVMEGEHRMENNRSKAVAINEAASLDCDGSDWSDAVMVDFMDEENAEMLAEEEIRKLYAAMSKLTERQQEIIQLYFYKGLNQ